MKTLYIERSAGNARDGSWVEELDVEGADRIVVGIGPGSFAGIRSALAFAQGFAIGSGCEVLGLPSACASAEPFLRNDRHIAVLGDARQGKIWIALFDGYSLSKEVFQVDAESLPSSVPEPFKIVSPDDSRIGSLLRGMFGPRYLGLSTPTAKSLEAFAVACPEILKSEPLPLYLNPAVRN